MAQQQIFYQCVRCGYLFEKDIAPRAAQLRCPNCGYPVIRKPKPNVAKLFVTSQLSEEAKLFYT